MTTTPGSAGFDVDLIIPPNDTTLGIELLPTAMATLDLSVAPGQDQLDLILGSDGPIGPPGPTGPTGVGITTTESITAPTAPKAGDLWVHPGPPRVVQTWDGAAWQDMVNGPTGPPGPSGPSGPTGPVGALGPTGPQGVAGEKWFYGPTPPTQQLPIGTTTNLATNPSGEVDLARWIPINGPTLTRVTANPYAGSNSIRCTWDTKPALEQMVLLDVTGLTIGQTYTVSVYVYVPAGSPPVTLESGGTFSPATTQVGTYQRIQLTVVATAVTQFLLKPTTAATNGQQCYFDAAQVELGSVATTYFDGSSTSGLVGTHEMAFAWTGTPHASSSTRAVPPTSARSGDWYMQSTGEVYELVGAAWTLRGSFRGQTGATGPAGMAGLTGPFLEPVRAASVNWNTITLSGLQLVDNVMMAEGDRVLVRQQSSDNDNGIYIASANAWVRAPDADTTAKVDRGTQVYVREGDNYRGQTHVQHFKAPGGAGIGTWKQNWFSRAVASIGGAFHYPAQPSAGELFANQNSKLIHFWDGASWLPGAGFFPCTSTTRPGFASEGCTIYETDTGRYYVMVGSTWTLIGDRGLDTGWVAPTLANNWVNYGTTWETAAYMRKGGVVYIRGFIKSGTVTTGTTIFTLPAGFRPGSDTHFDIASNGLHAVLNVYADGRVTTNASVATQWVSLRGLIFPADQ